MTAHRADVQGLRAFAVVMVVLDHLFGWPGSGFVGVDVFFVISGFLITGLLLREYERTGSISWSGFYIRRIRRIAPAAALVLVTTVLVAAAVLPRSRFDQLRADVSWSAGFVGNWRFVQSGTDYFQQGLSPSPVQHFWSLSVEEQFYFVWPWLLLAVLLTARRKNPGSRPAVRLALVTIAAVTVASFAFALWQTGASPTIAYFSTLTRGWELGLGACAAVAVELWPVRRGVWATRLTLLAMIALVVSVFVVPSGEGFPAPGALLPVAAAAVALVFGAGAARPVLWPLTNRVSGYVGDLSYSLYLWHFPVIVLVDGLMADGTPAFYLTCLAAMTVLSVASYVLVENPVRRSRWLQARSTHGTRGRSAVAAVAGVAVIAVPFFAVALAPALAGRTERAPLPVAGVCLGAETVRPHPSCRLDRTEYAVQPTVNAVTADTGGAFTCWAGKGKPMDRCTYGVRGGTRTKVALVGDSHAAMLIPALRNRLARLHWQLDTYVGYDCVWRTGPAGSCPGMADVRRHLATGGYDVVLTTGARQFQSSSDAQQLRDAWRQVTSSGGRVVVVADNPQVPADTLSCIQRVTDDVRSCRTSRADAFAHPDVMAATASGTPGVRTVDLTDVYCDGAWCPAVIGDVLVYRDTYGHISATWSRSLGATLADRVQSAMRT